MPSYERTSVREPSKHTYEMGHNGCCKTCVHIMETTAQRLTAHIETEAKDMGELTGMVKVMYQMMKLGIPGGIVILVMKLGWDILTKG